MVSGAAGGVGSVATAVRPGRLSRHRFHRQPSEAAY